MRRPASNNNRMLARQRALWLVLALLLAYLFSWALSAQLALGLAWLGQAPSEAVLSSSIAAFVLYPALLLWLLCARQARRNALWLSGLALALLAMQRLLAGAG
ncbi:hypothetical protein [Pseudomonas sp. AFG_SD02_1510_Pfu_092]|uniref:hypothetical protein n=1 Tax=Pseudomonas sp. AFG_SD02_1510_Pfu_092 TaxID=2259497 RepID=UPI001F4E2AAC|nr:hypothetical protein [Pseudomonas sp. AFG_SD02_1510_Pfu_092]